MHALAALLKRFGAPQNVLRSAYLLPILSILLCLPSLRIGFNLDDYLHRAMYLSIPGFEGLQSHPLNPFSFYDGSPSHVHWMVVRGFGAWWTHPELRVVFWRPFTALTHALDYALWPNSPALMHAHNLLWFGALIGMASALYRRWLGLTPAALLASLLYAIDDAHGFAVGWIANRNALIATTFGLSALYCWDRARRDGWRMGDVLTPLLLGLALLSGEFGLATGAWLVAHTVVLDSGPWYDRLKRLLPSGLVMGCWAVLYILQGSGTHGSASYINPILDPLRYLSAVLERIPILLQGLLMAPPADAVFLLPPGSVWILSVMGIGTIVLALLAFIPLLKQERTARFFALGSVLSLLPICATLPMDRLLFFVGLGGMGLLSLFILACIESEQCSVSDRPMSVTPPVPPTSVFRRARRGLCGGWMVLHLGIAPLLLPIRSANPGRWTERLQELSDSLVISEAQTKQTLFLLNAPDGSMAGYLPLLKTLAHQPIPQQLYSLAVGTQALFITVVAPNALEIRPEGGFLQDTGSRLVRDPRDPLPLHTPIDLPDFRAIVLELTADGRPARVRFEFPHPLTDASYRWLRWRGHRLEDVTLPGPGHPMDIPSERLRF